MAIKKEAKIAVESEKYIRWLSELSSKSGNVAGGKGANLAEMYNSGFPVPPAFAVTAQAFDAFLSEAGLKQKIESIIKATNVDDTEELEKNAKRIRELIINEELPHEMEAEILEAYEILSTDMEARKAEDFRGVSKSAIDILKTSKELVFVAVRSSATTEDLSSISQNEDVLIKVDGKPFFGKINEAYNNFTGCEIEVPSMKDSNIVWARVEKIYKHEAKNVNLYRIETERGREITVSPNHSLIVLNRDNLKPKTITIGELKENDVVPATARIPEINSGIREIDVLDYIHGEDVAVEREIVKIKNNSTNWGIQNGLPKKINLTNEFAYFLGFYEAEGCTYKDNCIILTNTNGELITKAKKFLDQIKIPAETKINKHSLRVYCKSLVRLLHAIMGKPLDKKGKGRSCRIKKVPNFIFGCEKGLIQSFLRGCFDGDGCVSNRVSYSSASRDLVSGMIKLLEILGIDFIIKKGENKYNLDIPSHEINKFREQIGFSDLSKMSKLNNLIEKYNKKEKHPKFKDHLFISEAFSEALKKRLEENLPKEEIEITLCPRCNKKTSKTSYYKNELRHYCYTCKKAFYNKSMIKTKANSYVNYGPKGRFIRGSIPWNKQKLKKNKFTKLEFEDIIGKYNLNEFSGLLNSNVNWDRVKKVTPIQYSGPIYDFTVPGIENFAAGIGGIITHNTASFAGQQETYTNIKGNAMLIEAVKKCFASLYTARAVYYRHKKGFKESEALLSAVVQRMVNSEKSGVVFTKNPMTGANEVVMEAVFGLGEGIVSGKIKPDQYIVSPDLEITAKKISEKKTAIVRMASGEEKIVKLTEGKGKQQVMTDGEIKILAGTAIKIEEHYKKPQDIEFAVENGKVYIVQTRPITTLEKEVVKRSETALGSMLLSGLAASPGIASGIVKIVKEMEDLKKIKAGDVLVTKMTNPDMVVTMQKAAAIVTDEGGATAHAAIVSREMGIACVVGTERATEILKDGMLITVDGTNGKVYEGGLSEQAGAGADGGKKEILPIAKGTRTRIKVIVDLPDFAERAAKSQCEAVGLMRLEGVIAESGKHPLHFLKANTLPEYTKLIESGISKIAKHFKEVWVRTSDIRSDEFRNLLDAPKEIEINPMLGNHGIRFSLKNPGIFEAEIEAARRVAEKHPDKKIGLMFPQIISENEMAEAFKVFKKYQRENLVIGAMIETPAAVQVIRGICKYAKFISFGTNDLTQYTLAIDRGNSDVQYLYDETHPAVLSQIRRVIEICRDYKVESSICGQAGSKKEMIEFLVRHGINSISVNADAAFEASRLVKELEEKNKNHDFNRNNMANSTNKKPMAKILPIDDLSEAEKIGKKEEEMVRKEKEKKKTENKDTTEVTREEGKEEPAEGAKEEKSGEKKESGGEKKESSEEYPVFEIGFDPFQEQK